MAGQQMQEKLRKLNAEQGINWVSALPAILRQIHDLPGPTGFSPYEILFGRERELPMVPFAHAKECEDAELFFQRMQETDRKVAEILNTKHAKKSSQLNLNRPDLKTFTAGSKVWYLRPERSGDKLDSRWLGPALILERTGESSYVIRVNEDKTMAAHVSFLRPYIEDEFSGKSTPLYFHQRTVPDPDAAPDEWNVEKILRWEMRNGVPHFLVKWENFNEEDANWEPIDNFFRGTIQSSSNFVASKS